MNADNWRAPALPENETLIFDEPGRVLLHDGRNVCYRAFHYRLTAGQFGGLTLRVKHGGGEESQTLALSVPDILLPLLRALASDGRFLLFHTLRQQRADGLKEAAARTAGAYRQAFVDGRLRKRKERGANRVKVWIEPAAATA